MCRHLAYVGEPIGLAGPLLHAPHALVDQARTPRFQTSGQSNPDGFGVAWYPSPPGAPRRYRTATAMWSDEHFARAIAGVTAPAFVGSARLASPGAPVEASGNAPFVAQRWSFSHNGSVDGFRDGVGEELRATLSARRHTAIEGAADSEVMFAMVLDRLDAGAPAGVAVADVVAAVEARTTGRLNVILTDGCAVVATAVGNSLFARAGWVASEPVDDDPTWARVPDRALVRLAPGAEPVTEAL